jgi:hypothetical protein
MRDALRLERLFQETVNLLRIQSAIQTAIAAFAQGASSNRSPIIETILDRGTDNSEDRKIPKASRAVSEDGIFSVHFHD